MAYQMMSSEKLFMSHPRAYDAQELFVEIQDMENNKKKSGK